MPHQQNLCIEDEIENKFVHVLDFNKTLLDTRAWSSMDFLGFEFSWKEFQKNNII